MASFSIRSVFAWRAIGCWLPTATIVAYRFALVSSLPLTVCGLIQVFVGAVAGSGTKDAKDSTPQLASLALSQQLQPVQSQQQYQPQQQQQTEHQQPQSQLSLHQSVNERSHSSSMN